MVLRGHRFLGDEVVAVSGLEVRPYHRPIGLRRGGASALNLPIPAGPFEVVLPLRVGSVGQLAASTPLAAVVLLRRSAEHSGVPELRPLTLAQALVVLANQTLGARGMERSMFHRLEQLVRAVPVSELHYADVDDAVGALESLLERPSPDATRMPGTSS
jgi:hypothetical protein